MLWKCCTQYAIKFEKLSGNYNWKRPVFIPILKKGNDKECSNCCTIAFISHASKIALKILQARLQQYVNQETPDIKVGFRKGRAIRDQISKTCWILEKAREFQKNIYFCLIDHTKAFDCVDHNNHWKFLKRWDYQTTLPASWDICMQVKKQQWTRHETMDSFQIGKGVHQGCIFSPCLFNLYEEYIMWCTPSLIKHKLESRFPGKISITSDMQMTPPVWQKVKRNLRTSWCWSTTCKRMKLEHFLTPYTKNKLKMD